MYIWEERFIICENVLRVGLGLCSGGIFGFNESWEDWIEMFRALVLFFLYIMLINFFIKNLVLFIDVEILSVDEVLECVFLVKEFLFNVRFMVVGGCEVVFKDNDKKEVKFFEYGINVVVLGDYLIIKGKVFKKDIEKLFFYGLIMVISCY